MYRARRRRRLLVATVVSVVLGAGAAAVFVVVLPLLHPTPTPRLGTSNAPASGHPSPLPNCATAGLPDAARLGSFAWITHGTLTVIDLGTCRRAAVVVSSGARPPVGFSADGRWLAFGEGDVVPAGGGAVTHPFGTTVLAWAWSPTEDVLAGVTLKTGVLIARPEGRPRALLAEGSGVGHLAFAPDGRRLALDRLGAGIQIVDVSSGKVRTAFHQPDPARAPEVAGWSPDGGWVLYWRGRVGATPAPLDAVPVRGGPWLNLFDPVLPYRDFLSACGDGAAVSGGAGQAVTVGKQILLTRAPQWQFHNLTHDYTRSWIWPACSPNGRWVAAVATPNRSEEPGFTAPPGPLANRCRRVVPSAPDRRRRGSARVSTLVPGRAGSARGGPVGDEMGVAGEPVPDPGRPGFRPVGSEVGPPGRPRFRPGTWRPPGMGDRHGLVPTCWDVACRSRGEDLGEDEGAT